MGNLAHAKKELHRRGITQERVALEVQRIFPDRTCSKWMVNAVLNERAKSSFVSVAIERLLAAPERRRPLEVVR